tara:strand:+ start:822 stop:998 length:177 start_codon:yes stop_codon:yes gene_type:complete
MSTDYRLRHHVAYLGAGLKVGGYAVMQGNKYKGFFRKKEEAENAIANWEDNEGNKNEY